VRIDFFELSLQFSLLDVLFSKQKLYFIYLTQISNDISKQSMIASKVQCNSAQPVESKSTVQTEESLIGNERSCILEW